MSDEQAANAGQFAIEKIYLKDMSLETPASPQIFQQQWEPAVNMDLSNAVDAVADSLYEVCLSITVTVSAQDKPVYLVEVQQAGIFHIAGFANDMIARMAATVCLNILFPFAREVVSDLVTRAGFPQLLLAPVNFEALYLRHQERLAEEAQKH